MSSSCDDQTLGAPCASALEPLPSASSWLAPPAFGVRPRGGALRAAVVGVFAPAARFASADALSPAARGVAPVDASATSAPATAARRRWRACSLLAAATLSC